MVGGGGYRPPEPPVRILVQPGSQSVRFVPLSRNLLIVEVIIRENAESGQE